MGCVGSDDPRAGKELWPPLAAKHHAKRSGGGPGSEYLQSPADKLFMCNIAQMVNVLQSLLLTDGSEGRHCIRTTTYYAFMLFKPHRSKTAVRVETEDSSPLGLSASASKDDREMIISLVNPRYDLDMNVNCRIEDARLRQATAQILHDADYNACNTFDHPDRITLKDHPVHVTTAKLQLDLPRLSVVTIRAARG